jgi:hypothetical protein
MASAGKIRRTKKDRKARQTVETVPVTNGLISPQKEVEISGSATKVDLITATPKKEEVPE